MTMSKDTKKTPMRNMSASEVAKSPKAFDTWASHQGCELAVYSDLPEELKADVATVFDVRGRLPICWVDEASPFCKSLGTAMPEVARFLRKAFTTTPWLFSESVNHDDSIVSLCEISAIFLAWMKLQNMRRSREKWSESDFASNVYNIIRGPAIRQCTLRTQCTIALAQPLPELRPDTLQATRILRVRTATPDGTTFINASVLRPLSTASSSPWKLLSKHPTVKKACKKHHPDVTFRDQSTPCTRIPDRPCFEFASCFWEDKKPQCDMLEQAYRQNRMSTTAAVRHLVSLQVHAPVYGLIWENGIVRAHVDWSVVDQSAPTVFSAPYPGYGKTDSANDADVFHEWDLDLPSDILQVFLLVKNIDTWTAGGFVEKVEEGIRRLVKHVDGGGVYRPWKRHHDVPTVRPSSKQKENINISVSSITTAISDAGSVVVHAFPTPPKAGKSLKASKVVRRGKEQ